MTEQQFEIQIEDGSTVLSSFVVEQNTSSVSLYDWQRRAIDFFFSSNFNCIFEVTTGAGKTFCSIEIIKRVREIDPDINVLIVVPKNVILEDTWFRELYNNGISLLEIGVFYGKIKEISKITITNMHNLNRINLDIFDMVIYDECFSGDTNVLIYNDGQYKNIPIKEIVNKKEKYIVPSFNVKTGKIEHKKISNWFKIKEKRDVLDIELHDGTILTVTPEQLLYTEKGYVQANKLKDGDKLLKW